MSPPQAPTSPNNFNNNSTQCEGSVSTSCTSVSSLTTRTPSVGSQNADCTTQQQQQQQEPLLKVRRVVVGSVGRFPTRLYLTCDDDHLSPYQCLLRKQMEFFEALEQDVYDLSQLQQQNQQQQQQQAIMSKTKRTAGRVQGRNKPIVLGQVGIRCMHCYRFVPPNQQPQQTNPKKKMGRGAMYYPATLQGMYQAAQNMASIHFLGGYCASIPIELKEELQTLRSTTSNAAASSSSGGKLAWAYRAAALGVYEDYTDEYYNLFYRHQNNQQQQETTTTQTQKSSSKADSGSRMLRFWRFSDRLPNGDWPVSPANTMIKGGAHHSDTNKSTAATMKPIKTTTNTKRKAEESVEQTYLLDVNTAADAEIISTEDLSTLEKILLQDDQDEEEVEEELDYDNEYDALDCLDSIQDDWLQVDQNQNTNIIYHQEEPVDFARIEI